MSYRELAKEAGVSLGTVAADAKVGADLSTAGNYLRWRRKHRESRTSRRREKPVVAKRRAKARRSRPVAVLGDSWPERIERARQMERASYQAYLDAAHEGDAGQLERLQAAHVRAINAVADVEALAGKSALESKHVVEIEAVKNLITECFSPIRQAMDKLPINLRTACNPEHPEIAERALREWVQRFTLRTRAALEKFRTTLRPEAESHTVPAKGEEASP